MANLPILDVRRAINYVENKANTVANKVDAKRQAAMAKAGPTVQMLETFQKKHPILGLKALVKAETTKTRHGRIDEYVGANITHQVTFDKHVAEWMFYHPGIEKIDADNHVRETMVKNYLDKAPGGDFRAIGRMLEQAKSGGKLPPELEKIQTELKKFYPEMQKKRRNAILGIIAALLLGAGVSTVDESTKGGLRPAPGY